jgi:nucleotide-binding universal stress UspA family protein
MTWWSLLSGSWPYLTLSTSRTKAQCLLPIHSVRSPSLRTSPLQDQPRLQGAQKTPCRQGCPDDPSTLRVQDDPSTSTELFQVAASALEEVRKTIEKWNPGTTAEILGGEPEVEILRTVKNIRPGMLVVGLSVHGHLWELIVGSTGEAIIEQAPCPVL